MTHLWAIGERHHVALHWTNRDGRAIAFELAGPRAEGVDHGSGLDAVVIGPDRDQAVILDLQTAQAVFAKLDAATQGQHPQALPAGGCRPMVVGKGRRASLDVRRGFEAETERHHLRSPRRRWLRSRRARSRGRKRRETKRHIGDVQQRYR
jgi:hypothetical protein